MFYLHSLFIVQEFCHISCDTPTMSRSEYSDPLAFLWDELDEAENGSRWVEGSDSSPGFPAVQPGEEDSRPPVIQVPDQILRVETLRPLSPLPIGALSTPHQEERIIAINPVGTGAGTNS